MFDVDELDNEVRRSADSNKDALATSDDKPRRSHIWYSLSNHAVATAVEATADEQKSTLLEHHESNPTLRGLRLANGRSRLSSCPNYYKTNRKNDRIVTLPDIEERILEWVLRCEDLGVCITG
ncbi:hypothetical protein H257_14674 [Aphanomyces astaci]|uniref:HTH CENPB-type domain-containing protein n=1 Tax=Aphanomyces astaci TaxID=112090 RepID=W4FRS8_APHAT|nr:hypothetical protein H257_14674 [Aphanomyces astaci]ETV69651.1 hypothetical protein H257_14674 [Aphanomyces astaci]|eukprot:XP_009840867.1 hypothetical protein H257_14674 [Aphanomyces astaci]